MSWDVQDRYVWLGFGVFFLIAAKGISHALRTTIHLSEVFDPHHAKAKNETQAEDSISLKALSTLASSPNPDIATAAVSLILSRFCQDEASSTNLTQDLFSSNPTIRQQARQVLELFDTQTTEMYPLNDKYVSTLHDKSGPTTQIMCRAYFRASRRYRQGRLPTLTSIADAIDESTMVAQPPAATRFPESNFVFPVEELPLPVRFQPATQQVESLVDLLADQAVAARPTVRFASGLSTSGSSFSDLPSLGDVEPFGDVSPVTRTRLHSESAREAEVRRWRREAMVLHEGRGGVIGSDNIIHPRTNNGP